MLLHQPGLEDHHAGVGTVLMDHPQALTGQPALALEWGGDSHLQVSSPLVHQ